MILNLFISCLNLYIAKICFETKTNVWGWVNIILSAINFALFLKELL